MQSKCSTITLGFKPRKMRVETIEVTEIGTYVNFDKVVDGPFISEMVFCEFQKGMDAHTVLFVKVVDVMAWLLDYVELVTKDATNALRKDDLETYTLLMDGSVGEAHKAIASIHAYAAEKKGMPDTFVMFSNPKF